MSSPSRNDPCPCGSGKKYKKCCLINPAATQNFPLQAVKQDSHGFNATNVAPPSELLMQAVALHQAGKLDEAEISYRSLLRANPNDSDALHYLGLIAFQKHRYPEAINLIETAIKINRWVPAFHCNLGNAYKALGQFDSAIAAFQEAVRLDPQFQAAHSNLGNTFKDQGRLNEAVASHRRALALRPDFAEAHNNLAGVLRDQGNLDEAVSSYRKALSLKPDYAEAHSNLGVALQEQGKLDEAVINLQQALALYPDHAETYVNLAIAIGMQGKLSEAIDCNHRALSLKPDFPEAHYNLANMLRDQGKVEAAIEHYQKALSFKPGYGDAYNNLLYLHAFTRDISPESECELAAKWENNMLSESERVAARNRAFSFAGFPRSGRRLKIGVVSAEIGQHAVAEFLEPFLEQFDRARFHVTLYPTAARSEFRADRLRKFADEYQSLIGMTDKNAAEQIRSDQIDILIDTTGHMRGCRLGIFAHRAAPVQCHYIGYHGTTGLTEMDWFIADEVLVPPACDTHFREKIWRLPRLWISYRGDTSLPGSHWKPDSTGAIWLGSFNNLAKVREDTLALWAKVMQVLPEARILLKDRKTIDPSVQERITAELIRHGISSERVEFAGHVPDWGAHMAMYDKLDIALDTIPLNSGTTAFDALWMGVPLVALEGGWMGGRMSSTILKSLKKPEWIAQSEDEYVKIVAKLARDVEGRKSLRVTQRALMADSPLCDAKGLTRSLESACEEMFERWRESAGLVCSPLQ